jgi:hypothetical protein
MAEAMQTLGKTKMVSTQTGTDGAFVASDVAPGDYYLFADAPGYVSPLNRVQALIRAGADLKKPLPGITIVHVTADRTAMADVSIERGAAVSGVMQWDDGSPVTGALMAVVPAKPDAAKMPSQFGMLAMASMRSMISMTDDLGRYRISGLAQGDYLVQATLQTGARANLGTGMNLSKMMATTPMIVFAPAAFHKTAAKPVTLHAGEDLRDQTLTLNLGGLHSVSGRVASAEDQHGINSATVKLQDDSDKDFSRSAPLDAAGNFVVTFVPPGTYTMNVTDAKDTEPKKEVKGKSKAFSFDNEKTLRSYQDGKLAVIVGDVDVAGQNLELPVNNAPKKEVDYDKIFGANDKKPPSR